MNFIRRLIAILAIHIAFFATSTAHAALIVSWQFDQTHFTAWNSDRIPITATITNSASSDQTFDPFEFNSWGYSYTPPNFAYDYYYLRDPQFEYPGAGYDLWSELSGLVLAPGESHQFLFFVLVPSNGITGGGYVPNGTYDFGLYYYLHFDSDGGLNTDLFLNAQNGFTVTVVPIPAAIWLFVSGLAGLAGITAVQRKKH